VSFGFKNVKFALERPSEFLKGFEFFRGGLYFAGETNLKLFEARAVAITGITEIILLGWAYRGLNF